MASGDKKMCVVFVGFRDPLFMTLFLLWLCVDLKMKPELFSSSEINVFLSTVKIFYNYKSEYVKRVPNFMWVCVFGFEKRYK